MEKQKKDARLQALANGILQDIAITEEEILEEAIALSHEFTEEWKEENAKYPYADRGCLCIRVRKKDGTFYAVWQNFWFVGPKNSRRKQTSDVNKGRAVRFTLTHMRGRGFKDWEIELFKKYEPGFAQLREESRRLGTVRRTVKKNIEP